MNQTNSFVGVTEFTCAGNVNVISRTVWKKKPSQINTFYSFWAEHKNVYCFLNTLGVETVWMIDDVLITWCPQKALIDRSLGLYDMI